MKGMCSFYKRIMESFKGIPISLINILVVDLGVIVFIDVYLRYKINNESFCYNFVNLVYTLGLSYVASFIFYYVQVHLKEIKDKKKVLPSVERLFSRLVLYLNESIVDTVHIMDPLINSSSFDKITKDMYMLAINTVKLNSGSSVYQDNTELTWLQYYKIRQKMIEDFRLILLDYAPFLGERGISLLADLRSDVFLYMLIPNIDGLDTIGFSGNLSLSEVEVYCAQYYDLIKRINDYYGQELKAYKSSGYKPIKSIYKGTLKQIII